MAALDDTLPGTLAAPTDRNISTHRRRHAGVLFWIAAAWIALITIAALTADWLPLQSPTETNILGRRMPPGIDHLLGTDALGRDILSRLVHGARVSLMVGFLGPLVGTLLGGPLGILAGYFRGRCEAIIVSGIDMLLAFPPLILALAVTTYLGQSVVVLTMVLGLLAVPSITRVARATTLTITQREFVTAARALGASHARIIRRELLPNVVLPLGAYFMLGVGIIIVVEGSLSFLGLGVPPPMPSWGVMIGEGRESLDVAPHIAFIPAITLFVTVLGFNLIGDTLRALTDPREGAL